MGTPTTDKKKQNRKRQHVPEESDSEPDEFAGLDLSDEEGGMRIDDIYIPPPPKSAGTAERTAGPRLIITKITNNFFKSYASQQVLGPFHKCFNAIIGPNGSGKSNVIDSMLFVFGYRASKIRSKKVSVLLHNSEQYHNVQSCTVAVHFVQIIDGEGEEYEIVPGSEFVVSRTGCKDNSSYYEVNGRRVQFKEVATLLKQHGIDLDHNRFLILQGEVEQISMMKCKAPNEHDPGMLEYLEDIIGTSRYKVPLVKLQEKIEFLAERRIEKLTRVNLVKKDLDELKEPMEEAVNFLKTENKIVFCKNLVYQMNIYTLEEHVKTKEDQESGIKTQHQELMGELSRLHEEKKKKEHILKQHSKKYEDLEQKKETLKEAFNAANKKDMQLLADMTNANNKRKSTKQLLAEEQNKLVKLEKIPEENQKAIEECQRKEEELSVKKEKLEADKVKLLESVRNATKDLQERKEKLQTDLVDLNVAVDSTKSEVSLAESKLKLYLSNEQSEKAKLDNLREAYETAETTLTERNEAVKTLRKKIPLTEKSLNSAIEELNQVKHEEAQAIGEIKMKRASLEEARAAMQASSSKGKVIVSLLDQKKKGNCPGLFGRLGDLGAIDQKYDVAVSTACGRLDNIVVDTVNTAQWCIEYLKKYDIGKATFIALDKQEHLRQHANSTIQTPENVPRLYDLIRIEDERVKTAFYFALRNTLVANDLEQASRVAYGVQRFRVVTLKGEIIETTGTMSGGGKTVMRGRMGQSVAKSNIDPKDLDRMRDDMETLEGRVRELRQKQNTLENQIAALEPELRTMKISLEKYTNELQVLKQEQPNLARQLKAQENKCKSIRADPAEVKRLEQAVKKKKAAYEEAFRIANVLQVEVDAISKEIEEKTTGKIKAVDKQIKEATTTLSKCKAEITRLNVAIKTAARNAKNSAEKIATMEQDITKYENDLKEMKAQRENTEEDAKQLLKHIEKITTELEDEQEGYADIKKEVAELTKAENKLKANKIEVDEKLKNVSKSVNDAKVSIHQWRAKITQLKLQEIPNETLEELKTYTPEELQEKNIKGIENEMRSEEEHLKTLKPNLKTIEEYRLKRDMFIERSKELDAVSEKMKQMRDLCENVKNKRKEEFLIGYNIIKLKLKEMYQMITLGGDATLEMVDSFDPFTEGIQFNVRPPKKSWKIISNLSGGEKTLSSLALVFALHYYKPSPLYVMDEIDAALDFKNVSIVGNYIKERTKNAQFIIISLRPNMFELCDRLVGIYKTYNCTQSVTVDPREYEKQENTENRIIATQNAKVSGADKNVEKGCEDAIETEKGKENEENENEDSNGSSDRVIPDSFEEEMEVN